MTIIQHIVEKSRLFDILPQNLKTKKRYMVLLLIYDILIYHRNESYDLPTPQ